MQCTSSLLSTLKAFFDKRKSSPTTPPPTSLSDLELDELGGRGTNWRVQNHRSRRAVLVIHDTVSWVSIQALEMEDVADEWTFVESSSPAESVFAGARCIWGWWDWRGELFVWEVCALRVVGGWRNGCKWVELENGEKKRGMGAGFWFLGNGKWGTWRMNDVVCCLVWGCFECWCFDSRENGYSTDYVIRN